MCSAVVYVCNIRFFVKCTVQIRTNTV
uniref:Uncharacterized protein n=1 Tax=Anopheles arabiensis TaxID=7173 RepID=A0A182IF86_ANOAR